MKKVKHHDLITGKVLLLTPLEHRLQHEIEAKIGYFPARKNGKGMSSLAISMYREYIKALFHFKFIRAYKINKLIKIVFK